MGVPATIGVAKLGLGYAEPLTFLALRMITVVVLLAIVIAATRPKWPHANGLLHSAATGLMVHGLYLGGVFVAIENGLSAGLVALIVSLQPVLTSTVANRWLGERVMARQWCGLALGLAGVYLVLQAKIATGEATPLAWIAATVALVGITVGTLYQKRFGGGIDWRPALADGQYAAAGLLFSPGALAFETRVVHFTPQVPVRARLARPGFEVARRGVAVVFPDPPRRGNPRGEPVLSHPAGDGLHGVSLVQRRAGAAVASRHGSLRRRRVSGELAAAWGRGLIRSSPRKRGPN